MQPSSRTIPALRAISCSLLAVLACGCGKESQPDAAKTPETKQPAAQLPASLFLPEPPANALSVSAARREARTGAPVVVHGKILGSASPFAPNRAVFTLGDPDVLQSCDLNPEDNCTTPWDVCCEPAEEIQAATATIQVVDAMGAVLRTGLEGTGGLAPLKHVVIRGTVAQAGGAILVINATGIHVGTGADNPK